MKSNMQHNYSLFYKNNEENELPINVLYARKQEDSAGLKFKDEKRAGVAFLAPEDLSLVSKVLEGAIYYELGLPLIPVGESLTFNYNNPENINIEEVVLSLYTNIDNKPEGIICFDKNETRGTLFNYLKRTEGNKEEAEKMYNMMQTEVIGELNSIPVSLFKSIKESIKDVKAKYEVLPHLEIMK